MAEPKFEMPEMSTLRCGACAIHDEAVARQQQRRPASDQPAEAMAAFMLGAADVIRTDANAFRRNLCAECGEVFAKVEAVVASRLGERR